jgi:hypothetical protein
MTRFKVFFTLFLVMFFGLFSHWGCKSSSKGVSQGISGCLVPARVVRNLDHTDCLWLLHLSGDRWLLPLQTDVPLFEYVHLKQVRIRFSPLKDVATPCSIGEPVHIHCVEPIETLCRYDATPVNEPWLRAASDKARRGGFVKRGRLDERWFYVVSDYLTTIVYDCRGNEYCRYEGKVLNDCARMVNSLVNVETWNY